VTTTSQLIELRRKTDRELPVMVQRELERGLILARVPAASDSPLHAKASEIYSKMKRLLPALDGVGQHELSRLESKLQELWVAVEKNLTMGTPRQTDLRLAVANVAESMEGFHQALITQR
jgi:hypothetical protein